jgi:hypothetical protein
MRQWDKMSLKECMSNKIALQQFKETLTKLNLAYQNIEVDHETDKVKDYIESRYEAAYLELNELIDKIEQVINEMWYKKYEGHD